MTRLWKIWFASLLVLGALTEAGQASSSFTFTVTNSKAALVEYFGDDQTVTVPSTYNGYPVTEIRSTALYFEDENFTVLNLILPNTVTKIDASALNGLFELESINLPASVSNIDTGALVDYQLTNITVDPANTNFSSYQGALYNGARTTLIQYPEYGSGVYTVPYGVRIIRTNAFESCTLLSNVTLPATLTNIQDSAFAYNYSLQTLFFLGNAPTLGNLALASDTDLTSYYLSGKSGWSNTFGGFPAQLLAAPSFINTSTNATAFAGVNLGLSFQCAGQFTSYQWNHNGTPTTNAGAFSGTNAVDLNFRGITMADAGTYTLMLSNLAGVTNSPSLLITVLPPTNAFEFYVVGDNQLVDDFFLPSDISFSNAVALSPTNFDYHFYLAAAELLSVPSKPIGSNFLNHLGFPSTNRDLFHWNASPSNTIPAGVSASELVDQLRTNILYAIISAETNLACITDTNYTINLTSNETHAGDVTVDWGDIQLIRAGLDALQFVTYTVHSWNFNAQLTDVSNLLSGTNASLQTLLTNYPNLFTLVSTTDTPAARDAFVRGINQYFIASQFIRNRNLPDGTSRLITYDTNNTNEVKVELELRQTFSNLLASLNGPVTLTTDPHYIVSMGSFFSNALSPRSFLPTFLDGSFVWNTFPDVSFGGVFSGLTELAVDKAALKPFQGLSNYPGWNISVLYNFEHYSSFSNFTQPLGIVQGTNGALYGVMSSGGTSATNDLLHGGGFGCIYKIDTNGQYSVVYNFGTVSDGYPLDGAYPNGLMLASDGNFYGTTQSGGMSYTTNVYYPSNVVITTNYTDGTVFKMTHAGQLTTLHVFGTGNDQNGSYPEAPLAQGPDGRLYGTTRLGGTNSGAGTVFAITTNGNLSVLATFPDLPVSKSPYMSFPCGAYPAGSPLLITADGTIYGTTPYGGILGTTATDNVINGYGTLFQVTTSGALNVLHCFGSNQNEFGPPLDGAVPDGLVYDSVNGLIYGTTQYGGLNDDQLSFPNYYEQYNSGDGTLFSLRVNLTNSFTSLWSFDSGILDPYQPIGQLVVGGDGRLYGVASAGGGNSGGSVFSYSAAQGITSRVWFTKTYGEYAQNLKTMVQNLSYTGAFDVIVPVDPLLSLGLDKKLYGVSTDNGANNGGTVYSISFAPPVPTIASLVQATNALTFTWPTGAGYTYQVQYKTTLADAVWHNLNTPQTATGTNLSYTESLTNSPRFYRVEMLAP